MNDVTIIGVGGASGNSEDEYAAFVNSTDTGAITQVWDPAGDLWGQFDIFSQPAWVLVNDDGTSETVIGSFDLDDILDAAEDLRNK